MIALSDIRAGYEGHVALDRVSCGLAAGRTTAVLGPGGSGKSTLLRVVAGPVLGLPAGMWCEGSLRGVTGPISYLPQRPPEVALARPLRALFGGDEPADEAIARVWRDIPGPEVLRDALAVRLGDLPASMHRLAGFTAALASPGLLLLDEPDGGVGERERGWIRERLVTLRGQRSVVLITHDLELARAGSDDSVFLLDGCVVEAADTASLFTSPAHPRTRDLIRYGA